MKKKKRQAPLNRWDVRRLSRTVPRRPEDRNSDKSFYQLLLRRFGPVLQLAFWRSLVLWSSRKVFYELSSTSFPGRRYLTRGFVVPRDIEPRTNSLKSFTLKINPRYWSRNNSARICWGAKTFYDRTYGIVRRMSDRREVPKYALIY